MSGTAEQSEIFGGKSIAFPLVEVRHENVPNRIEDSSLRGHYCTVVGRVEFSICTTQRFWTSITLQCAYQRTQDMIGRRHRVQ
jgi:hypothetical protein